MTAYQFSVRTDARPSAGVTGTNAGNPGQRKLFGVFFWSRPASVASDNGLTSASYTGKIGFPTPRRQPRRLVRGTAQDAGNSGQTRPVSIES